MPASSPFDSRQAEAGRTPTLAVLVGIFMVSVTPFVAGLVQGQTAGWGLNLLYAVATAALLYSVWRGSVWAWRLTVGMCMVAGLVVFVIGMLAGSLAWRGWIVSGAGLAFLLLGTALVGTAVIRAFLDSRWEARRRAMRRRA